MCIYIYTNKYLYIYIHIYTLQHAAMAHRNARVRDASRATSHVHIYIMYAHILSRCVPSDVDERHCVAMSMSNTAGAIKRPLPPSASTKSMCLR